MELLIKSIGSKSFSELRNSDLHTILDTVRFRGKQLDHTMFSVVVRSENHLKFRLRIDGTSVEATLHKSWMFYIEEVKEGLYWDVTPIDNAGALILLVMSLGYKVA